MAALGWEDHLVARSHECDYPASVLALPACTGPRFDVEGSSAEIDRRVRQTLEQGPSVYWVDADLLDELQPTLVITQDQCEVCAVDLGEVERACRSIRSQPEIVALNPGTLEDVWSDIRTVARAVGVEDEGRRLAERLSGRVEEISRRARTLGGRPKVACVEWIDPLMIAGYWMPELVALAGGEAVLGRLGGQSRPVAWHELAAAEPDAIVLMPCGFDINRSRRELESLAGKPEWESLPAVLNDQVFVTDGNHYFNRSGPRLVESVEILAEILSQTRQNYGHQGIDWIPA